MSPLLNVAIDAAREAGRIIIRHHNFTDRITVQRKGANDFVSSVDIEAEREIIGRLRKAHPDHSILAEEEAPTATHPNAEYQWLIDPLDGTTNYLAGIPHYAVSIAVRHHGRLIVAVIFDPIKQELFTAEAGRGAHLNDRRIRARTRDGLEDALLTTGFPYQEGADLEHYLATLKALLPGTAGVRRPGAASLDLAYVAAGRFDGFWEFGLKPWDIAAGILIAKESGVLVRDLDSEEGDPLESGNLIAASPRVLDAMLARLANI